MGIRGGPHWRDGFRYSGSDDIGPVASYGRNGGNHTREVAQTVPNQLGIYDRSDNVWEWGLDSYTPKFRRIPADGSPFIGGNHQRVLRGGYFHNWAAHCRVAKRYQIEPNFHGGCIGFRLVVSAAPISVR